jgi:hypothetical protein
VKGIHIENLFHLLIFSVDFFFEGVYNKRQVKTVGRSDSTLFYFRQGGSVMKKVVFLLIIMFFLAGCTAEWYKHDTIYKDHDHMFFSWGGYKSPTPEKLQKSESQGWWGAEIPYIPAE